MSKLIKKLSGDFTIISNKVFRNKKLGVTDRGTLCTLLSLPDNWNFSIRGLAAILPDGVTKIENSLNRLEHDHHYLKRVRVFENGRIVDWDYIISDEPMLPDEDEDGSGGVENVENSSFSAPGDTDFQDAELLDTENPYLEKRHLENRYAYKELNNQKSKNKILCDKESFDQSPSTASKTAVESVENSHDGMIDGSSDGYITDKKTMVNILKEHIGFDEYVKWTNILGERYMPVSELAQIIDKLAKAATCGEGRVINREKFTKEEVQAAVLNINMKCIERAVEKMRVKAPGTISAEDSYMVSVLINLGSGIDIITNSEERSIEYDVKMMFGHDDD
ncbi:MAG: hypothetical protein IJJ76_04620 [Ruminococcus sp.]|uniref:hypothetical protein n=1 Tax=Ruminococcus sp. TaxID=41978 RepID=UPI0025D2773B|nr:hypothetical protein [Ruminococcus sp.]MBR0529031.1 hypothetical protein [Ruminococcus sp.]